MSFLKITNRINKNDDILKKCNTKTSMYGGNKVYTGQTK